MLISVGQVANRHRVDDRFGRKGRAINADPMSDPANGTATTPSRSGATHGGWHDRDDPDQVARNTALVQRIVGAHRIMTAALADLLDAVRSADELESYWVEGSQSAPEWLVANLRIHANTARAWARMAKKLADYPTMRAKMTQGVLGYDQVQQLLKYVEPEQEAELVEAVTEEAAEQLEDYARSERRVSPRQVADSYRERWFEDLFDHDELRYTFRGEITGQDGLVVHKALRLLGWNSPEEPVYDMLRAPEHRLADALVEMASSALANQSNHDTATVVVHADVTKLALDGPVGQAEFGIDVPMEAIRRLTCDGRIQLVARGVDGCPIGVGRVTRTIPAWLRRLVRARDKGCRFPGCGRTYWTQIHHIVHWAHGGPTDLDNVITLCGYHHRMLHEDGWQISGDPNGEVSWLMPGGTPFERKPGRRSWETMRDIDLPFLHKWAAELCDGVRPSPG